MEGLYRFALQCVCKIERLFSVECNSYYVFRGGDLCSCLNCLPFLQRTLFPERQKK